MGILLKMKKILVFIGGYLPGYKYGGALRSLVNLVNLLGDEFEFYIEMDKRRW